MYLGKILTLAVKKLAALVAQQSRICPPMQVTWFQFLVWEDPPEEEMAPHSSVLAWKIPWTEEPGGLQSVGLQRIRHDLATEQQQTTHREA